MKAQRLFQCTSTVFLVLAIFGSSFSQLSNSRPQSQSDSVLALPEAPVRPVLDDYFGTKVVDPYRYIENLKDPEVEAWFKSEDDYTRALLAKIPGRPRLLERIKELDQSAPYQVQNVQRFQGEKYFYQKMLATDEVGKLYERDGPGGAEKLLVDPNTFATAPGTHYSLNYYVASYDGRYVAYGVSPGGSEDAVIHILDVASGRDTGEAIDRSWYGGIAWLPDNRSFVHIRFQKLAPGADPKERRLKSRVYLHRVGTDAEEDAAVFGYGVVPRIDLDPSDGSAVFTDPRSQFVLATVNRGFANEYAIYMTTIDSLGKPDVQWKKICGAEEAVTGFDFRGDDLFLVTHKNAPRYKVIRTSFSHPDLTRATVVVPQGEAVIQNVLAAPDALYVQELDGGIGRLLRVPYDSGASQLVSMPVDGTLELFGGDPRLPGLLLGITSWTKAYRVYFYDPDSKRVSNTGLQPPGPFDDPADIEATEVKARSYDGTMVPLSIIAKKGIKLDGSHPALLSGYGAYAINMQQYYDATGLAWLERGGVLAVAHVRGGGEYGEAWHQAAMNQNKPNTWRDFIACAEYLIQQGYTSSARLAGEGGSAGGILIGRAFTERPDLFAAALDDVGISDMIRDMFSPDGLLNVPEYGDLKTQDGFKNLYEDSAYYHVKDGTHYPAIMLTTGMNDPRVVSWEPGKMAARLQAATAAGKPVLLRVDYQGGHGGWGATRSQMDELRADQWSFLLWQFGVPEYQPPQ
ncbi:MAG TPA: prolyl oligopeptidase family serine peptidase [Terriglobales bacterium]|nr:prolyl oligopeptidase family serine peptidase [Terriglobales bacterium]